MSSHTPGPWVLSVNNNWKTNPFSVVVRGRYGVHSTTVANVPTRMTIPPQEQQANARLLASAPLLHKALTDLLSVCYDVEKDDETVAAVAQARAVLADVEAA